MPFGYTGEKMEIEKYLKELQKTEDLLSLTNEELSRFAKKTDEFLSFIGEIVEPLKNYDKFIREFLRLGLSVEAAMLYREQARVYREKNDEQKYLRNLYRYYETLLMTLYIPPVYEDLMEKARTYENTSMGPLFYYLVGFTQHFHLFEYERAYDTYLYALNLLDKVNERVFNKYKLIKYRDFKLLLLSNMVDTLLRALFKEGKNTEYISYINSHLNELRKVEKDKLFFTFNEIEFNLCNQNINKAASLLMEIDDKIIHDRSKRHMLPILYRTWALFSWQRGDTKGTVGYFKRALKEAIHLGDELRQKEIIDTIVLVLAMDTPHINILSQEGKELLLYLLSTLLSKDWYLGEDHSKKVAEYSRKVAKAYAMLGGKEINPNKIYLAGLLHDTGKLYIPWYILNKPTKPMDLEWESIKYHPTYGAVIVKNIGIPTFARYVEEHHERIDGSGYPYGIKDPHIISQIIGIVDDFAAATALTRKYQKPLSKEEAIRELEKQKGMKFHPKVVEALKKAVL